MIVLYSTNCPRCKVLEEKLTAKNIEFKINENIEEMQQLGIMSVPVLQVDDNLFLFKEANDWINEQEVVVNEN